MRNDIIARIRWIGCLFLAGIIATTSSAQQGFYVPAAGNVFFSTDSSAIFSNVINYGRIGLGKNAVLNFSGRNWYNDPQSLITDESADGLTGEGGWIRFLTNNYRQVINGGYNAASQSGPSFSRIEINNAADVSLDRNSMKVRHTVKFSNGLVYLGGQMLVVGHHAPGIIDGYTATRYFVTGERGEGMLIRENISKADGRVVFPVGTSVRSYTPAAISSRAIAGDDYYVSVSDSVWTQLNTGTNLRRSGVNKTWQAGKRWRPGEDEVELWLQHSLFNEGIDFYLHKTKSYIASYTGSQWDTANTTASPGIGELTTGDPVYAGGLNARLFQNGLPANGFFTKFALTSSASQQTGLFFNATRLDKDRVHVYWNTNPEVNVKYFVVERRLINETGFTSRDTISSRAANGYSNVLLSYMMTDANSYTGMSFYRLQLVGYNGEVSYSLIVPVGPMLGLYTIHLWPNPTPDVFYISIPPVVPAKTIVVWNVLGQKLIQEEVNGRTLIAMRGLLPGNYYVSIISNTNHIIETKKLVVVPR